MLEDILNSIASWIPAGGAQPVASDGTLPINYICSVLGGLILSKFTGNVGVFTIPLNVAALFIGATLASTYLQRFDLPFDRTLEQPLIGAVIGMSVAAIVMMIWLKRDNASV